MKSDTRNRFLFLLPAFILISVFLILPMAMTMTFSMTDWNGLSSSFKYTGLKNFIDVVEDERFMQLVKNTLTLLLTYVPVLNIVAYLLAVFIYDMNRGVNLSKTVIFIPNILSMVVVGFIWISIFSFKNGLLNVVLRKMGLDFLVMDWLGVPNLVLGSISIAILWFATGFYMLIYLSGLSMISEEIYESAAIEGAGWFTRQVRITLPMIRGAVSTNIVLSIIGLLGTFDLPYIMTKGGPVNYSETIALRVYLYAFRELQAGKGMALAIILTFLMIVITLLMLKPSRK